MHALKGGLVGLAMLASGAAFGQPLVGNAGEKEVTDQPLEVTPQEITQYTALLRQPEVVFLRKTFDRFAKGDTQGMNPIALHGIQKARTDGMRHFDAVYFKSKFTLIQTVPGLGGGRVLSVVFVDKPDRVFDCWVFKTTESGFDLRAFTQDTTFVPKEIEFVYRNVLKEPKLRL